MQLDGQSGSEAALSMVLDESLYNSSERPAGGSSPSSPSAPSGSSPSIPSSPSSPISSSSSGGGGGGGGERSFHTMFIEERPSALMVLTLAFLASSLTLWAASRASISFSNSFSIASTALFCS